MSKEIRIEGYSSDEILAYSDRDLDQFVFTGTPLVFRAGTAEVLGQFEIRDRRLIVELAHIDGGGEGLLPTVGALIGRIAERRRLLEVEWLVHAVNCANPNPKLRRVLDRRGFVVIADPRLGQVYRLVESVRSSR